MWGLPFLSPHSLANLSGSLITNSPHSLPHVIAPPSPRPSSSSRKCHNCTCREPGDHAGLYAQSGNSTAEGNKNANLFSAALKIETSQSKQLTGMTHQSFQSKRFRTVGYIFQQIVCNVSGHSVLSSCTQPAKINNSESYLTIGLLLTKTLMDIL